MEDTLYDPYGGITTCSGLIAMRGGWDALTASEASFLASLGCTPGSIMEQPLYSEPYIEQPFVDVGEVSYTAPIQQPQPLVQATPEPAPIPEEPSVTLSQFFAGTDIETNPIEWTGFQAPIGIDPTQIDPSNTLPGQIIRAATGALQASIETGITVQDARIRGRCAPARRRFKVITGPDGQPQVISVCPPRRMNPCNPRALGRAARRLSMFQKMSSGIEKIINRQLKRRAPARRAFGCAPKRCR